MEPSHLLLGMKDGAAIEENMQHFLQWPNVKSHCMTQSGTHSGFITKRNENLSTQKRVQKEALFIKVNKWKKRKRPSGDEQIKCGPSTEWNIIQP